MSLINALVLSPATGVSMVTQFDKTTGLFFVLPPIGAGAWMSTHDFTVLWVGDLVQFRTIEGVEQFGVVTSLDWDDWSIEVMTVEGEYGYPLSHNVVCVVGRDMPTLTTAQQGRVSANLVKMFTSKIVHYIQRLPAIAGGR